MSVIQQLVTIALAAVTNFITRWLPFQLFTHSKDDRQEPAPFIKGLGAFLPPAIMTMLVVYCYRNLNFVHLNQSLPELLAGLVTVGVHLWQRKMFLSLTLGRSVTFYWLNLSFNVKQASLMGINPCQLLNECPASVKINLL